MSGALLLRIAQGEQQAFAQCLKDYGGLVWGIARRFSPTRADAEDAAQDVFLHLWKNARHYDPGRGSEAVFIATLARRVLISRFRGRQRRPQEVPFDAAPEEAPPQSAPPEAETCAEAALAAAALAQLPADQQQVIGLAVLHGLSHSEIAALTGRPLGTVKTLLRRGLMLVRERLGIRAEDQTAEERR
jgi:RNA polymerase sigma-70 factor (ECF subfamily)